MQWVQKSCNNEQFDALKKQGIAPVFCTLLSNRSFPWVITKKDIGTLIESPLSQLEDATCIQNMEKAAEIFVKIQGKDAVIFGDYDADGILSAYMCERLLLTLGASSVDTYLPSRIDDGYGLNKESVDNFLNLCKKDYQLVVILDCGTSARNQIDKIRKNLTNSKLIIIDHHIVDSKNFSSNADYVVNPRLNNSTLYCAGGLMYQMVRQCSKLCEHINHINYLPYAAITTITDVCTIVGANRIIVKNGLDMLKMCQDPGINALFKVAEVDKTKCSVEDISYTIGPMINASGRIKIAAKAFQLLRKKDEIKAVELAKYLHTLNEERKKIQKVIAAEAIAQFEKEKAGKSCALLYNEKWNTGIVGIVASKIVDKYKIPAICFGKSKEEIKGSARSIPSINIKSVMDMCPQLFIKYGGHEMAAGATLNSEYVQNAWEIFNKCIEEYKNENKIGNPITEYDFEVDHDLLLRIDSVFCDRLSMLEPYGHGNEMPLFYTKNVYCREIKLWKSGVGAFVNIDNTSLPCFTFGENLKNFEDKKVDILFNLVRSFIDGHKWNIRIVDFKK